MNDRFHGAQHLTIALQQQAAVRPRQLHQNFRLLQVSACRKWRRIHRNAVFKLESAGVDHRVEERFNLPGDCNFVLKHSKNPNQAMKIFSTPRLTFLCRTLLYRLAYLLAELSLVNHDLLDPHQYVADGPINSQSRREVPTD